MKPATTDEIFRRFAELNPHPKTELDSVNCYTFLVAVILSAQSTDKGVNKATPELFKRVQTPEAMMKLGEAGLKKYIATIGLLNAKARNIMAMSKALVEKFKGDVPRDREDLESLPGVGRKTANVFLNNCYNEPVIAVDRHVLRVSNRIGLAKGDKPEQIEEQLMEVVPKKWQIHASHWLVLHGRYICLARVPLCFDCPIADLCQYPNKTKRK